MKLKNSERKEIMFALSLLTQIGISMAAPIFGCVWLGAFIDRRFGTSPLFLIVFIIIGVMTAFRTLYIMTMRQWKDKD